VDKAAAIEVDELACMENKVDQAREDSQHVDDCVMESSKGLVAMKDFHRIAIALVAPERLKNLRRVAVDIPSSHRGDDPFDDYWHHSGQR
jgi:hypothetical protein